MSVVARIVEHRCLPTEQPACLLEALTIPRIVAKECSDEIRSIYDEHARVGHDVWEDVNQTVEGDPERFQIPVMKGLSSGYR
jgi:hypothetical protein